MRSTSHVGVAALSLLLLSSCVGGEDEGADKADDDGQQDEVGSEGDEAPTTGSADAADSEDTQAGESGDDGGSLEPVCESELSAALEGEAVATHLQALYELAMANEGTRAAGTPGYEASAEYVEASLEGLGYTVTRWDFEFDRFVIDSPTLVSLPGDQPVDLVEEVDFRVSNWSPSGEVEADIEAVDLELGLGNSSTSGCEPEDFAGFAPGKVALIQRGQCNFKTKAQNAEDAGAVAVLIFNQGNTEDRMGLYGGSLGSTNTLTIPVLHLPYDLGVELAASAELEATPIALAVDTILVPTPTFNVFAETPGGDPDSVVMLGAHLDSVPAGPGVNDNGSGSATILELARQFAACEPHNKVRFAWWGAEEWGLIGSRQWVEALPDDELASIALYLNFDMVASPNYVRYVHSGDTGPEGSTLLYDSFLEWYEGEGLATTKAGFSGRSDYQPFVDAGIPAGGLATGAGGSKSESQAETYGGMAGSAYDGCYHQACDDADNFALDVLGQNAKAAAHVLEQYAGDLGGLAGEASIVSVPAELAAPAVHECGQVHE